MMKNKEVLVMLIKFTKRIWRNTFGYFTPHFYKLLLIISVMLLFLAWYSGALSYTEEIEGVESLPKVEIEGMPGDTNIQGEDQQKLDVYANEKFIQTLVNRNIVCGIASEEEEDFISINSIDENNQNKKPFHFLNLQAKRLNAQLCIFHFLLYLKY